MKKHMKAALLCGILGCLCYGGGDWLMSESMILWFGIMLIWERRDAA